MKMAKITAVSDSGPLMALAKLGVLYRVFSIYATLIIPETVYHEVVTSGLVIGARDANGCRQLLSERGDCNFSVG